MKVLRSTRFWLGIGLGGLFLWLAFRHVPLTELKYLIAGANYFWLLVAVVLQLLIVLTRAERWRLLLGNRVSLADAFWAQGIGYLFTNILPFRLGEPARIVAMTAQSRLPLIQVTATVLLERLLDVAVMMLLFVGVLLLMDIPAAIQQAGLFFGLVATAGLLFVFALVWWGKQSQRWITRWSQSLLPRYSAAISLHWQELLLGFVEVRQGRTLGLVVAWSLITWGCSLGMYWSVLLAFQSSAQFIEAAFVVVALGMAVSIPSGPGFIGIFQWAGQQALVYPFGTKYNMTNALVIILTAHMIYYVFTTLLGIVGLWRFGRSFVDLWSTITGGQES